MLGINSSIDVLLVEDDDGDVELTREALVFAKMKINLHVVSDGLAALEFLQQRGVYRKSIRPDLILLDLNLPRMNGKEFLKVMKKSVQFRKIPVVIFTTSSAENDISETYGLGANCFISKPVGLEEFSNVVRAIEDFWFTVVKLPSKYDT